MAVTVSRLRGWPGRGLVCGLVLVGSCGLLVACPPTPPIDQDGDGYPASVYCSDAPPEDGARDIAICDCANQDDNPAVYPGAADVCNGNDDDCDGLVDEEDDQDQDGVTTVENCPYQGAPQDLCDSDSSTIEPCPAAAARAGWEEAGAGGGEVGLEMPDLEWWNAIEVIDYSDDFWDVRAD